MGAASLVFSVILADLVVLEAASSASGSYPSFSIRSASSFAFFSAASKSTSSAPPIFFAPSLVFFTPKMLAFRGAPEAADLRMTADGTALEGALDESLSEPWSGDFDRVGPLPFALGFRKGDAVRLMTGGVCVLDGGLLGRLIEGLSQDEKKSSPASAGVEVPSAGAEGMTSVTTTSSG